MKNKYTYPWAVALLCALEFGWLIGMQHRYAGVLKIGGGFYFLLILITGLTFWRYRHFTGKTKKTAIGIQAAALLLIPIFVLSTAPSYTYAQAVERVTSEQGGAVVEMQKYSDHYTLFGEPPWEQLTRGYLFDVVHNEGSTTYAFEPWSGNYFKQ